MEGRQTRRRLSGYAVLAMVSLLMAGLVTTASADHSMDRNTLEAHCPDHRGHPNKIDNPEAGSTHTVIVDGQEVNAHFSEDLKSVEFTDENGDPIVVEFCIKAADRAGGKEIGDEGHVSWLNNGGQVPQISYIIIYRIVDCDVTNGGDGEPEFLDLEDEESTNPQGSDHTVTATVTDAHGNPCKGVAVHFQVEDGSANSGSGGDTTDASGQATFTYTGSNAGDDTITACFDPDDPTEEPESCTAEDPDAAENDDETDTVEKTWEPDVCDVQAGEAEFLDLENDNGTEQATNTVGDEHTVIATVTDANGNLCNGVAVHFQVQGAHTTSGGDVTGQGDNADGEATFSYTGTKAGNDTITACFDPDDPTNEPDSCTVEPVGDPENDNETDSVSKTWQDGGGAMVCWARILKIDNDNEDMNEPAFVLFESPDPLGGCPDHVDGVYPDTIPPGTIPADVIVLSTQTNDEGSASARILQASGSPGTVAIGGADADCNDETGNQAFVVYAEGSGQGPFYIPSPPLGNPPTATTQIIAIPTTDIVIYLTRVEGGTAQLVVVEGGENGEIAVLEAHCSTS